MRGLVLGTTQYRPQGHTDTLTPSCARPWWAGAGHGCSESSPHPGASPPAPRSRSLTLLGPSTARLFHAGSGGGESGAVRPGLAGGGGGVTSSFSSCQAGLASLMERQSLGIEAGGAGAELGGKLRQTRTHAHTHTLTHTHTHGHADIREHTCTHTCTHVHTANPDTRAHTRTHVHAHTHTRTVAFRRERGRGRWEGRGRGWGGGQGTSRAALPPA